MDKKSLHAIQKAGISSSPFYEGEKYPPHIN